MNPYSLEELESALITRRAHVLIPALAHTADVCARCRGAKGSGYRECLQCGTRSDEVRSSKVGIINYVPEDEQLYDYFIAYKNPGHANSAVDFNVLSFQMYSALVRHLDCSNFTGVPIDFWTNVPSTRRSLKGHDHPLQEIASAAMTSHSDAKYLPVTSTGLRNDRSMRPDRFQLIDPSATLAGAHGLIVDDLWVTGGSVDSLAFTLHQHGASTVSALCLGRKLSNSWPPGRYLPEALKSSREPYDPRICPWNPATLCESSLKTTRALKSLVHPAIRTR